MAFLSSLSRRERIPELMDDPALDQAEHRRALAGLARLNRFSGSTGVLWRALERLAREIKGRPVRILDVATGSGDVPIGLWKQAARRGIPIAVEGCDISETALAAAREQAAMAGAQVRFFQHDALRDPLPVGFDAVTSSLFLHHLSSVDALTLLRQMATAGSVVLVNDLARSRFNYLAVWFACRVLSGSPVVRFDGPASVRSAFTPREALELAHRGGLIGATVRPRFPCRYLLEWRKL